MNPFQISITLIGIFAQLSQEPDSIIKRFNKFTLSNNQIWVIESVDVEHALFIDVSPWLYTLF